MKKTLILISLIFIGCEDSYNKLHLTRPSNIPSHAAGLFPNPSLWEFERQMQKRKRKEKIKKQYLTGVISRKEGWRR